MWLPPLNMRPYSKTVTAEKVQVELLLHQEQSSSSIVADREELAHLFWAITIDVCVNFCAETSEFPMLKGLNYVSKPILFSLHELITSSREEAEKIVFNKISEELGFHSRLSSTLANCRFMKVPFKSSPPPPDIQFSRWIVEYLFSIPPRISDGSRVILPVPVVLKICETTMIRNAVYQGWLCWYYSSKTINSEFEKEYTAAISRPRTVQEIAGESFFVKGEQALTAVLKDIKINLDDKCSICLEELSDGRGGLKSLRCAHIFHGDCITTWLLRDGIRFRNRVACPLCRRPLHSKCIASLCPLMNLR